MNIREANATSALIRAFLGRPVADDATLLVDVRFLAERVRKALMAGVTPGEVEQSWPTRLRPAVPPATRPAEPVDLDDELSCPRGCGGLVWNPTMRAWVCPSCQDAFPYRQQPHPMCGSNSDRQSVGHPGHCELCCSVGHVVAHPDYGCADVGCTSDHNGPEVTA